MVYISGGEIASHEIAGRMGKDYPDNVWSNTYELWYDHTVPAHEKFQADLAARAGTRETAMWPVLAYIGVKFIAAAAEKAGSTDADQLAAALEGMSIDTPVGPRTIDPETHQADTGQFWGPMVRKDGVDYRVMNPVTYIPPRSTDSPSPLTGQAPVRGDPAPFPGSSGPDGHAPVQPDVCPDPGPELDIAGDEPVHHRGRALADLRGASGHQLRTRRLLHVRRLHHVHRAQEAELGFVTGVAAAAAGLAGIAVIVERGLFRWLYDKEHLMQLLLTFAIVLLMGDIAKILWGTDQLSVSYPDALRGATDLGVTFYPTYRLMLAVIGPLIFLGLWLLIERTRWGRLTRAATQDMEMLSALGINVPMIYITIFVIGSALAGVGGALASPINSPTPGMDATIIVECFVIVIIGGLGSLWGSFVGALIYGFVFNFGSVIVPNWQDVFAFLLLMAVLLVRPWGLYGKPEREGH